MAFGYLPNAHPFLMSADLAPAAHAAADEEETAPAAIPSDFKCSNERLTHAMQTEAAFDVCYRGLVHQAIEAWSSSLRMRSANKLRATIAALEQCVSLPPSFCLLCSRLQAEQGGILRPLRLSIPRCRLVSLNVAGHPSRHSYWLRPLLYRALYRSRAISC